MKQVLALLAILTFSASDVYATDYESEDLKILTVACEKLGDMVDQTRNGIHDMSLRQLTKSRNLLIDTLFSLEGAWYDHCKHGLYNPEPEGDEDES